MKKKNVLKESADLTRIYKSIGCPNDREFLKQYIEDLHDMALRDKLTGLFNRRQFDTDIRRFVALVDRTRKDCSLVLIDIDNFKKVNDIFGHSEGDRILKETSETIVSSLREYEKSHVYRYGGEEIAVLLPETSLKQGLKIAERIRQNIANNGNKITVSLGVSNYKDNCHDLGEFVDFADSALYHAKNTGKNRVETFDPKEFSAQRLKAESASKVKIVG